jgi:hypothetical protein
MPLTTAQTDAFEDDLYMGVVFAMLDGDRRVICRVTKAALEDRSAKNGRRERAVPTFCRYRPEIEAIASVQYDSGVRRPVVESEDLVPIRVQPNIPRGSDFGAMSER